MKGKKRRRKINPDDQNKFSAYFNYLPFEKAVIESKGKDPYNNQHVEEITKINFDYLNSPVRAKSKQGSRSPSRSHSRSPPQKPGARSGSASPTTHPQPDEDWL